MNMFIPISIWPRHYDGKDDIKSKAMISEGLQRFPESKSLNEMAENTK